MTITSTLFKPIEELYTKQIDHFWRAPDSRDFSKDIGHWNALPASIKRRIKIPNHLLAHMEPEVVRNLGDIISLLSASLGDKYQDDMLMVTICLDFQKMMEGVHTLAYRTIDSILECDLNQGDLDVVAQKVRMLGKYADKSVNIQMFAQVCAEGLAFACMFPMFFYLRKKGLLPGTCKTNLEVLMDENMHTETFIVLLRIYRSLGIVQQLSQDEAYKIIESFVDMEDTLTDLVFGNMDTTDKDFFSVMNVDNNRIYTRIVANILLETMGYQCLYPKYDNPYPFVEKTELYNLVGFFDCESADYGTNAHHPYDSDSDIESE